MIEKDAKEEEERHIPLTPSVLHILLALGEGPQHGYGIMKQVEQRTRGLIQLGPGILYGSLKKMQLDGLIEHSEDSPDEPVRRKYYCLTRLGRRVALLETRRLHSLLEWAHSSQLTEETDPA